MFLGFFILLMVLVPPLDVIGVENRLNRVRCILSYIQETFEESHMTIDIPEDTLAKYAVAIRESVRNLKELNYVSSGGQGAYYTAILDGKHVGIKLSFTKPTKLSFGEVNPLEDILSRLGAARTNVGRDAQSLEVMNRLARKYEIDSLRFPRIIKLDEKVENGLLVREHVPGVQYDHPKIGRKAREFLNLQQTKLKLEFYKKALQDPDVELWVLDESTKKWVKAPRNFDIENFRGENTPIIYEKNTKTPAYLRLNEDKNRTITFGENGKPEFWIYDPF